MSFVRIARNTLTLIAGVGITTTLPAGPASTTAPAKEAAPKMLWEISKGLDAPESSFYDDATKAIYISNVAGDATAKDGKGWISKVDDEGKMIAEQWATGLNAPKGVRIFKGKLWVSDIDRVVVFDVSDPKITTSIEIPYAKFLNDIAIGPDGTVYVSDMTENRIHSIKDGKVALFAEGSQLDSPNGLLVQPPYLRVVGWGKGIQADFSTKTLGAIYNINLKTKRQTKISDSFGNLDGIEAGGRAVQGFLVSDWMAGKVYHMVKSPQPTLLLEGLQGAADIGFIEKKKILLVPEMKANRVRAYQL